MRHADMFLIVGLALSGCSDPGRGEPLDAMPPADAGPGDAGEQRDSGGGAGLVFRFASEPSLPGDVGGEYNPVIEQAELLLVQVRAIGDSSPGGEGTSADGLALSWADGEAEELRFPQAPPGIYSQLMAELDGYEIQGTVEISGDELPFRIAQESGASIQISVNLDGLELEPGGDRGITIEVDLGDVIRAVEWDEVPVDEQGSLHVRAESPQAEAVRERLADAFGDEDDGNSGPGDGDGDGG